MQNNRYSALYTNLTDGISQKIGEYASLTDAKKYIRLSQAVPNKFYGEHTDLYRADSHYISILDNESGKVVSGGSKCVQITTLQALKAEDAMKIPEGHIYLYQNKDQSLFYHIDRREFDSIVGTIFSAETAFEYSKLKALKIKLIMNSRFYNNLREGLEDGVTGRLSNVIIGELGSQFESDTMFEDTKRHLLPYAIQNFHEDRMAKIATMKYESTNEVKSAMSQLDEMCCEIEGYPPKFFTPEWNKIMLDTANKAMDEIIHKGGAIEPIEYTRPNPNTPSGNKLKEKTDRATKISR